MAAVGLLTVTTIMPAVAANSALAADAEAAITSAMAVSAGENTSLFAAQSVDVPSDSGAVAIQRDGYTVTKVPTIVAATSGKATALDSGQLSDQPWVLPVVGTISSAYGARPNRPVAGVGDFHSGTDIASACGGAVTAASGGTVVKAGYQGTYGNWVLIDHGNGIRTGYAHNSKIVVRTGQHVAPGEKIATVGSTGASSGCHVHFETRINDAKVNPQAFMNTRGVRLG